MKRLSEKLANYIVQMDAISKESYEVYQYGFQIGLEMLCCFIACFCIYLYLQMVPAFLVFTVIFMLLRTYAGGLHLDSFSACFICSVTVQTIALLVNAHVQFSLIIAWLILIICSCLIIKMASASNCDRELDEEEKTYFHKTTKRIIVGIWIFSAICTMFQKHETLSLIALTVIIVLGSQYIGKIKYCIQNRILGC